MKNTVRPRVLQVCADLGIAEPSEADASQVVVRLVMRYPLYAAIICNGQGGEAVRGVLRDFADQRARRAVA